jgi:hypothetical protein
MHASCRNAAPVVAVIAAVYHSRMPAAEITNAHRVVERDGPAGRRILERRTTVGRERIVVANARGVAWPDTLSNAAVEPLERPADGRHWRLSSDEGMFEFEARAVDRVEERPGLYAPLHRRFALSTMDRLGVRALLWLLRLPGGARLLRRWHARRNA